MTRYFEAGHSRCLVGTRGLLGEGWDARTVNVLVDLTGAGTSTAVHQMRGRSLRLDPAAPRKVANNWDVVCVAPDHPNGLGDYARFVRKHRNYFALTAGGEIESGVSHVDPRLSPFGPPDSGAFGAINRAMVDRVQQRDQAHALWKVGEPYRGAEVRTVRLKFERPIGAPRRNLLRHTAATGGGGGLLGWLSRLFALPAAEQLTPADTVADLAVAVAAALSDAGAIDRRLGPAGVRLTVQPDGYYRCFLAGASAADSQLFAESLDEVLAPLASPRYVVPRTVTRAPRSALEAAVLALAARLGVRAGGPVVYHAVPSYLAANRERVAAFRRAWNRFVDRGAPLYHQDPRAQAILHLHQGEDPFRLSSQTRTLWT